MTKKLRIIGIIATVLGCGLVVCLFIFGIRPNPKVQEFLKSPDAAEKFSKTQNQKASKTPQVSPLVRQAQSFALYLNPPKAEPKPEEVQAAAVRPVIVTPKFTLVGTSVYPDKPELSRALIDEPGKGLHWVKPMGMVGHVTIKEIKDGLVVISEGSKTSELIVERPEVLSLLRNPPPRKTHAASSLASFAKTTQLQPKPSSEQTEQINPQQQEQIEQLASALAAIDQEVKEGKLDPNAAAEKTSQIMEKYTQERTRISSEESNNLDQLGADLKAQSDGNSPDSQVAAPKPTPPVVAAKPQTAVQTKPQTSAPTKPVPRARDPRRRVTRPPRAVPSAPTSETPPATPP